jgi:hypothetical protein
MLIRSQNKESLIAIDGNFVEILKYGDLSECSITVSTRDHSSLHVMARYSSVEKAMKVLDMIQEAYGDSEYTKYVIPEVCRTLSMKPKTEENKAHAGEIGEMLKKGMTFQMPEDSEVEV